MSTSAFTTTLAPIDQSVINVRNLEKTFGRGSTIVPALRGIDLDIGRDELTAIMDPSGSGKSTLMHSIVSLEGATAGTVTIAGRKIDQKRFDHVVDTVGLADCLEHRPTELSGGQQQRVACARAMVGSPDVVLADEPTGNLDSEATSQILSFLRKSVDELGQTVVMVTHEPDAAAWADRVIMLRDGHILGELRDPTRDSVLDALRDGR